MNEKNLIFPDFSMEGADKRALNSSRRDLLESTKLSKLPRLPERKTFKLPEISFEEKPSACVGCGGRLDPDDTVQQTSRGCRKCLGVYARLEVSMDEADKRKRRLTLERFAREEQR